MFKIPVFVSAPSDLSKKQGESYSIIIKGKIKGYGTFFCKIGFYNALNRCFAGLKKKNSSESLNLTWCLSSAEDSSRQAFAFVYFVPHKFTPNPYEYILTEYWRISRVKYSTFNKNT